MLKQYLLGSGHFAIGFCLGFIVMLFLNKYYHTKIKIQIYAPFIPFILGIWSALPYLFISNAEIPNSWLNIFTLYTYVHQNELFIRLFGKLHLIALICGSMYLYILLRYISLIKYCRRYGWQNDKKEGKF